MLNFLMFRFVKYIKGKEKKRCVNICFDKILDHAGDDRLHTSGFELSFQK